MAYCRASIRRTLPDLRQSIVLTAIWAVFFLLLSTIYLFSHGTPIMGLMLLGIMDYKVMENGGI